MSTTLTVNEILLRAGLTSDAIDAFNKTNPTKTTSLTKFQNALRARKYSVADGLLLGLDRTDAWDCYDSITMEDLSLWFISVGPQTAAPFDWDTQFTSDVFTVFGFTSGPPSPTVPPGHNPVPPVPPPAPGNVPGAPPPAPGNAPGAPGTAPGTPAPGAPTYTHSYHDAVLLADNQALARRAGTAATTVLTAHPLWTSANITGAVKIDSKTFLNTDLDPLTKSEPDAIYEWYHVLNH